MEQDTRIGLAMGILLIGVVGALFFRNETTPEREVPEIADAESLDEQIAERPIAPYLSRRRSRETESVEDTEAESADREEKAWSLPDFLKQDENARAPTTAAIAPDPIPREQLPIDPEPTPTQETETSKAVSVETPVVTEVTQVESTPFKSDLTEYRVRSGDTLSDIAERFLGSSARYMEIYELNRDRLKTPHDLRIGRRILVPRVVR